jgi:uncharacterized protein involved in outer membrane biogenesis
LAGLLTLLAWTFVASESVRHRIESTASRAAGMEVRVDGPVGIRVFPAPGLRLGDLRIRNSGTEWLGASRANLRVRILPLLRGRVEVGGIDLVEPDLRLVRDSDGAFNFIAAPRADGSGERQPFGIRRFRARAATLAFTDQTSGARIVAEGCDLSGQDLEWRPAQSPPAIHLPDFQGRLGCRNVTYGELKISGLQAQVTARDRRLEINPLTGQVFDGRLDARLESDLSGTSPAHALGLELAGFRFERFFETFRQGPAIEGSATFVAQLSFPGRLPSEMVAGLSGHAGLSGTGLVLHGRDLDEQLARYASTQRFNLVDTAAFFVAGPAGLAVTRGYGFASLFGDTDDRTPIRELVSEWEIEGGVAAARDAALSTAENRIALDGGLDFVNLRFRDMRVAVIDPEGCALVEQRIQGGFHDPAIEEPNVLVTLAAPFVDLLERGVALLTDSPCDPFYTGRVAHP